MDLTAFGPYALNVRTNISSYGPRARLIRAHSSLPDCVLRVNVLRVKCKMSSGLSELLFDTGWSQGKYS